MNMIQRQQRQQQRMSLSVNIATTLSTARHVSLAILFLFGGGLSVVTCCTAFLQATTTTITSSSTTTTTTHLSGKRSAPSTLILKSTPASGSSSSSSAAASSSTSLLPPSSSSSSSTRLFSYLSSKESSALYFIDDATATTETETLVQDEEEEEETTILSLEDTVTKYYPNAITTYELQERVMNSLQSTNITCDNTILGTSLCTDEEAIALGKEFYVNVFNQYQPYHLGGLGGFPFAGNTGFDTLLSHTPTNGYCFILYGPHTGITKDGQVGKVERCQHGKFDEIVIDDCCKSAIKAMKHITKSKDDATESQEQQQSGFDIEDMMMDFQQNAVQNIMESILITSLSDDYCDDDNEHKVAQLPYQMFQKQDELLREIVFNSLKVQQQQQNHRRNDSATTVKGILLLGGIQINTGPETSNDFFHPIKYDYIDCTSLNNSARGDDDDNNDNNVDVIENILPDLI